jgi:hypothetical protein
MESGGVRDARSKRGRHDGRNGSAGEAVASPRGVGWAEAARAGRFANGQSPAGTWGHRPPQRPPRGWLAQGLVGPKHQHITRGDQGEDSGFLRCARSPGRPGFGAQGSASRRKVAIRRKLGAQSARDFRTRGRRKRAGRGWREPKAGRPRPEATKPAATRRSGDIRRASRVAH